MLDNDIAFNPFKVVFGSGTKVQKYDKFTNVLTHELRKFKMEISKLVFYMV